MIVRILLVALCVLAVPVVASAQATCTDGRLAVEGSGDACCWPGQTWAADQNRCAGQPTCPAGRRMEGEDCVAPAAGERDAIGGAYFEDPIRHHRNSFNESLHQSGPATLFAIGYGPALMLAFSGLIPGTTAAPYVYNFIPVAGPLMSLHFCGITPETCATPWYWVYTIGDSIVQFAGAVFILAAMLTQPVVRSDAAGAGTTASNRRIRWVASPGAGSTPFGATIGVVTF